MKLGLIAAVIVGSMMFGCNEMNDEAKSSSGVSKASVKVPIGSDGLTVEQRNIGERLKRDNEPGSIKHLYVISSMTGQVLIYSTVKGKVTSGGKRLTPTSIAPNHDTTNWNLFPVDIGGTKYWTSEVLQDDGSYGSSGEYLFWFDQNNVYHQQYASACIIHISDQPLNVKQIVLNLELNKDTSAEQDNNNSQKLPAQVQNPPKPR